MTSRGSHSLFHVKAPRFEGIQQGQQVSTSGSLPDSADPTWARYQRDAFVLVQSDVRLSPHSFAGGADGVCPDRDEEGGRRQRHAALPPPVLGGGRPHSGHRMAATEAHQQGGE